MPPIIGAIIAIAGAIAAAVSVQSIVIAVVGAVISAGISIGVSALTKPKSKPLDSNGLGAAVGVADKARAIIENVTGTVEYIPVAYGTAKVGGIRCYAEVNHLNKLLMIIAFAEGEIEEFTTIEIDGNEADQYDSANKYYGYVGWEEKLGTDAQVASTYFTSNTAIAAPGWTENHKLAGIAYLALAFTKNTDLYPRLPIVTAIIKGKKVYDPRTGTIAWSNNPALCIRDYLTNTRYGKGLPESEIDDDSFIEAANYCDELVNLPDGTTQKRYTLNGFVPTAATVLENLDALLTSCNGILTYSGSSSGVKHRLIVMKPETSTFSFTKDNIIGSWTIEKQGKKFKKNKVEVKFLNPNTNWQTDIAIVDDASYLLADGSEPLVAQLEAPFTTNFYTAHQLGQVAVKAYRLLTKLKFKATIEALQCEVGDVVDLTHDTPGYSEKLFRVSYLGLEPDGNVNVVLDEYDIDVYSLAAVPLEELGDTSSFSNPFDINPPGIPSISQTFVTNTVGDIQNQVRMSWSAPSNSFVKEYQAEYKLSDDTDYIIAGVTSDTFVIINDLVAGTYNFRVKALNPLGTASEYSTRTAEIVNNTAVPPDVSGFNFFFSNGQVVLTWDENTTAFSGGGYRIKHSSATSGADWNDFPNFTVDVTGKEYSVTLGLLEGTYMIKAFNIANTESENFSSVVLDLPDSADFETTHTLTQDPTFSGTKTNMYVTGDNKLTMDGDSLFDSTTGNFDSHDGLFDDGDGRALSGSYLFSSAVDLGNKFLVYLSKTFTADYLDSLNSFDSRTGLFDNQPGLFDGTLTNTIDFQTWYRYSQDGATWSNWYPLNNNSVGARHFEFKSTIEMAFDYQNIEISALAALIKMKKRGQSASNVTVPNTGLSITYSRAFYSTPTFTATLVDGQTGDYFVFASESRTGINVTIKDSSNVAVQRVINWYAFGTGEQLP